MLAQPIHEHERDEIIASRPLRAQQAARRKLAEDRAEKLRKVATRDTSGDSTATDDYVTAASEVETYTVDPEPRWLVDDVTPESIVTLLAAHGSVGAVSAEPGLFSILAGRYSNGRANIEAVLKAMSGDPIRVDRISRETVSVDRPALSVSMCVQPGRLRELGDGGGVFRHSGLLARLLYVLPAPRVGTRDVEPPPLPTGVLDAWGKSLRRLLEAAPGEHVEELALTSGAYKVLIEHQGRLEPRLSPTTGDLADYGDWGAKLPGTVVRMAAALTLLADPSASVIEESVMADVVRLGEAFIPHAVAALSAVSGRGRPRSNAKQVIDWLRVVAPDLPGMPESVTRVISTRTIHQSLKGREWAEKVDDVKAAIEVLVDCGWLRANPDYTASLGKPGRNPSPEWQVHPRLWHRY